MLNIKEFDNWYDNEIERVKSILPNPNIYPNPFVEYIISFSGLLPVTSINESFLQIGIFHKITFKKELTKNGYEWKQLITIKP